jgi:drug/metabolite transporter (DMT)-like permease
LVALVLLLDPVLTAIAAWIAFGETLNLWNAIAFGVILFGVYLGISSSSVVQTQSDENLP